MRQSPVVNYFSTQLVNYLLTTPVILILPQKMSYKMLLEKHL